MLEETGAQLSDLVATLGQFSHEIFRQISQPSFAYQILIIAALYGISHVLGKRLETRLEARARQIKGHPGVLRMIVALMRRSHWILFTLFLFIALQILRAVTWPSHSYFISVVLSLSLAWLVAAVISRIIRVRFVAQVLALLAWTYAAIVVLGIEDQVGALLESLAFQVGGMRLSALFVIKAILLLTIAVWAASFIGEIINRQVDKLDDLSPAVRVLVGKVSKIGLIVLATVAALSAIGIDLTAFTVFSGAIGVGLGFGLQKVVSNFISGVIILLDKSIKPGDTISLGETFGWIRELRARFVSVVTRDGREYLIPNEDFVTQRVINWSFSDELVRLDVHFGVSYECDPHQVSELAIAAAIEVARVDANRRPVCWLTGFGESSLDFVLRFWIRDPQQGLTNVRGKVLLALWDTLKENDIEIPYPHREIMFKGGARPETAEPD